MGGVAIAECNSPNVNELDPDFVFYTVESTKTETKTKTDPVRHITSCRVGQGRPCNPCRIGYKAQGNDFGSGA